MQISKVLIIMVALAPASLLIAGAAQTGPAVSVKTLETYAGTYQLPPNQNLTITVEGDHLSAQLGPQKFPLATQSETKFLVPGVNAEIEFGKDETGAVTHIVVRQNGREQKAPRLVERKQVTAPIANEVLQRYVGRYALPRAGFAFVVTLEGGRLMAESIGQFKYPLYAESETSFFFKDVDAQIEFVKDAKDGVTHLVLHRGSVHEKALKN
jgi:hypothetical protein